MTTLQQLEAKIFDKLPELKQLGVGCEMKHKNNYKSNYIVKAVKDSFVYYYDEDYPEDNFMKSVAKVNENYIIGKPPTLVDVLKYLTILGYPINSYQYTTLMRMWSLDSIYLRDQDEALINFLNDLDNGL